MNGDRHVIDESLKALLEDPVKLFLTNRDAMKEAFKWQGAMTHCLCALLCADHATLLDARRVKEMRDLIRGRSGAFSSFRGLPILPLATLLANSLMPEGDLERVQRLYKALRAAGFMASPYLAEAAFLPLLITEDIDDATVAKTARDMVQRQRKARPFLDSQSAPLYALLAAAQGKEAEQGHIETELGYQLLKTAFPSAGTTYALARVLTLGEGETEHKCERVISLYQALRQRDIRYGKFYELPALGVLALLPEDIAALADGIVDMDARLRQEKGFSGWTLPNSQRILYAACLYAVHENGEHQDAWLAQGLIQSVTGVLIAAQTAASISAATAASAAASSAGGD